MIVLVLNSGSSSLKFQAIETDAARIRDDSDALLARGSVERIGSQCLVTFEARGRAQEKSATPLRDHRAAIEHVLAWLTSGGVPGIRSPADLQAVGHRVTHGGEGFAESVRVDAAVLRGIEDCIELAPLHNPANLAGIHAAQALLGAEIPQVAVFDTAFHAAMPETSFLYAIPYQYYRRYRVRRYGFHGTSHRYAAYRYRRLKGVAKEEVRIITLHLGNGCSACAISGGRSVDTTMGLTPLEGLVMGTRSGDVDPAIIEFLAHKEGLGIDAILTILNKQSGLLGVSGLTNDMRELLAEEQENGDRRARLAIDLFCAKVRKTIGAYLAELGGADAIVFTGGIGENSAVIRARICQGLEWMGVELDPVRNAALARGGEGSVGKDGARVDVVVVPANEELLIARDTYRCVDAPVKK